MPTIPLGWTYSRRRLNSQCVLQGGVLVFVYDMFSFTGPVLLQQLLRSLEDRSHVGEAFLTPSTSFARAGCRQRPMSCDPSCSCLTYHDVSDTAVLDVLVVLRVLLTQPAMLLADFTC